MVIAGPLVCERSVANRQGKSSGFGPDNKSRRVGYFCSLFNKAHDYALRVNAPNVVFVAIDDGATEVGIGEGTREYSRHVLSPADHPFNVALVRFGAGEGNVIVGEGGSQRIGGHTISVFRVVHPLEFGERLDNPVVLPPNIREDV